MENPNYIERHHIYDIFHNDDNKLVIIGPYINDKKIFYINENNIILPFSALVCPHKHTCVYTIETIYNKNIKIIIGNEFIETYVNKYPSFKDEIIFSTIVKDEDNYIKQWINFHLNLGVSRFIIYDNSTKCTLNNVLKEYIEKEQVLLFNWQYLYILNNSNSGQTTQQNHSIYAFNTSKYIGLFDIDEYINIQGQHISLPLFF
jgi:hypothetical protein